MNSWTRTPLLAIVWVAGGMVAFSGWQDSSVAGMVAGLLLAAGGTLFVGWSFRRGRHLALTQARAATRDTGGYVLWKPGCLSCERLLRDLREEPGLEWVNVWQDAAANAEVRSLNGGNEYTPTAVIGETVLRNPSADAVRTALRER